MNADQENSSKILQEFKKYDVDEDSLLTEEEYQEIIKKMTSIGMSAEQFSISLFQQILGECQKEANEKIMLKKFTQTILQGQAFLLERLNSYLNMLDDEDRDKNSVQEIVQCYCASYDDLQMISKPFNISFDQLPPKYTIKQKISNKFPNQE